MAEVENVAWANPSSVHGPGRRAREALETARRQVASACGVRPEGVVFTSGGTEACNLLVRGFASSFERVLTTPVEHPAVAAALQSPREQGREVVEVTVTPDRIPGVDELRSIITPRSAFVCQWVNHEVGTVFPVADYARAVQQTGGAMVVDGTQALGKVDMMSDRVGAWALAVSAHKMGGPSGVGAVCLAGGCSLEPLVVGGGQERGYRAGTPSVRACAGFGAACSVVSRRVQAAAAMAPLRARLEAGLVALPGVVSNRCDPVVSTVVNVSVRGWDGAVLAAALDVEGLCVSAGPACSSGVSGRSPTVASLWPDEPWRAASAIRLSMAPTTTLDEVDGALGIVSRVLSRA